MSKPFATFGKLYKGHHVLWEIYEIKGYRFCLKDARNVNNFHHTIVVTCNIYCCALSRLYTSRENERQRASSFSLVYDLLYTINGLFTQLTAELG